MFSWDFQPENRRLYLIEITLMIGFSAKGISLVLGMLVSGVFQTILLAISDLTVEIRFGLP